MIPFDLMTGMIRIACIAGQAALFSAASAMGEPEIIFADVTRSAGIDFTETIGDAVMSNIVEATGTGCGFLDYDGDGWMDIYFVNGCWREGVSDPKVVGEDRARLAGATDRLYRNNGDGTLEDATVKAGLNRAGYGMAVVAADYDGDGDTDIYVTNYGPNFLYRNNGDGTFTEMAKSLGVDDPSFSVGAVFLDFDRDGRLDLYVGNYLDYEADPKRQHTADGVRSPLAYEGQQDRLFRGNPDGTFTDVTARAGIAVQPIGRAMGVGALDYDRDGFDDIFVSNDAMENFLFRNLGNGTFENAALLAGVAFGESGDAAAAMAVEVGDYDGNGWLDILVPDMNRCCLYRNLGGGMFEDVSTRVGIARTMTHVHSWGGVFADFDLDGRLDIYITNGSACVLEAHADRLYANDGRGGFRPVAMESISPTAGAEAEFVSRGVAGGDFDNDGDVDLVIVNLNDRPSLLRNETPRRGRHWLEVQLVGRGPNRDAIGAFVKIETATTMQIRPRRSAGSYLSQHDPRLHFGLGEQRKVDRLEITWPDGSIQALTDVDGDRLITVRQEPNRAKKPD